MNFVVSSTELLIHLQAVSRVISSKNTLPILENFLFKLENKELTVTASDLETTFITKIKLDNAEGNGTVAIEAKRLNDILKEFPEQPLTFNISDDAQNIDILSEKGKYDLKGQRGDDFPRLHNLDEETVSTITVNSSLLFNGINKAIFATADDELRPVMNGIYIELTDDFMSFVASDAHKLVRYRRSEVKSEVAAAFILPKKPASLLKNILGKVNEDVVIEFDKKNAFFTLSDYKLACRLVEGKYPNYNSVIPTKNPNKLVVDRSELYNSIKRVSVFSNQASNLIKLKITGNQITISAQDVDFSISGIERISCQYEGDDMEIGFKSVFLLEILANLASSEITLELSDPSRAGILHPNDNDNEHEDVLMLLMPMMINV